MMMKDEGSSEVGCKSDKDLLNPPETEEIRPDGTPYGCFRASTPPPPPP